MPRLVLSVLSGLLKRPSQAVQSAKKTKKAQLNFFREQMAPHLKAGYDQCRPGKKWPVEFGHVLANQFSSLNFVNQKTFGTERNSAKEPQPLRHRSLCWPMDMALTIRFACCLDKWHSRYLGFWK